MSKNEQVYISTRYTYKMKRINFDFGVMDYMDIMDTDPETEYLPPS